MEINIPEIVEEVTAAFMAYEKALLANDVDVIDELFWNDEKTLRYGPNGTIVSHAALSAFRRGRDIGSWERTLKDTYIVTFGRDFAVANTESTRPGRDAILATLTAAFAGSPIVTVHQDQPDELLVRESAAGNDRLDLYVFAGADGAQARLVATLDNLGKGASGAAVQSLNLMAGLDPLAGLNL